MSQYAGTLGQFGASGTSRVSGSSQANTGLSPHRSTRFIRTLM